MAGGIRCQLRPRQSATVPQDIDWKTRGDGETLHGQGRWKALPEIAGDRPRSGGLVSGAFCSNMALRFLTWLIVAECLEPKYNGVEKKMRVPVRSSELPCRGGLSYQSRDLGGAVLPLFAQKMMNQVDMALPSIRFGSRQLRKAHATDRRLGESFACRRGPSNSHKEQQ